MHQGKEGDKHMKIKVYQSIVECSCTDIQQAIVFQSAEFGWVEYYENCDITSPFIWRNKKDMIDSTWKSKECFQKYGKIEYLGNL